MIYISFKGGLGNQLFQYAFARNLSLKTKQDIVFFYNRPKNSLSHEKYILNNFNITKMTKGKRKIVFIILEKLSYHFPKIMNKSQKFLEFFGIFYNIDGYDAINIRKRKNYYIYGFFQSEKYFSENKKTIIKELTTKLNYNNALFNEITTNNSVCIHVRKNDYVNLPNYNICEKNYYIQGIQLLQKKLNNPVFYIFSDDIEWCKKNIKLEANIHFIDNIDSINSFYLMYNCKHFIISNSSFSWWASYLCENKEKLIVSPNIWYKDSKQPQDLILKNFIKIEVDKNENKKYN